MVKTEYKSNGTCDNGKGIMIFEGDTGKGPYIGGDNPGSPEERVSRCSAACREKKNPKNQQGTWTNFVADGFIVIPGNKTHYAGRCYCTSGRNLSCDTKQDSSSLEYDRYGWRSIGLQDVILCLTLCYVTAHGRPFHFSPVCLK